MAETSYQLLPPPSHHEEKDSLDSPLRPLPVDSHSTVRKPRRPYLRWVGAAIITTLCGAIAIGLFIHRVTLDRSTSSWMNCGSTVEEAHARNCIYDVMIASWLLPECSDLDLMNRYLTERDWEFYRDINLTELIPMPTLRLGEHRYPVFATVQQHRHHCAYIWEKQFRSVVSGNKLDELTASTKHTHHCAQTIYDGLPEAKDGLLLDVKFLSCVEAGVSLDHGRDS